MTIARRQFLSLFAAGSTTVLTACGGGGSDYFDDIPTRYLWVLNLDPEFTSVDVALGRDRVVTDLRFPDLTPRIEAEFGNYVLGLLDRPSGRALNFSDFIVDDYTQSISVLYRHGDSARLGDSPLGIVNYFESSESLLVDLDDGNGNAQSTRLAFKQAIEQTSRSPNCRLRLRGANDGRLVYDSGLRARTDAIVVFPAAPQGGLVGVVALNYNGTDAAAVPWPNQL